MYTVEDCYSIALEAARKGENVIMVVHNYREAEHLMRKHADFCVRIEFSTKMAFMENAFIKFCIIDRDPYELRSYRARVILAKEFAGHRRFKRWEELGRYMHLCVSMQEKGPSVAGQLWDAS